MSLDWNTRGGNDQCDVLKHGNNTRKPLLSIILFIHNYFCIMIEVYKPWSNWLLSYKVTNVEQGN